jgi:long-chain acyl-CoA synthetase
VFAEAVERGVAAANADLARVEQIKKYRMLTSPWDSASDELTATMKLRRRVVTQKYAEIVEELYAAQ